MGEEINVYEEMAQVRKANVEAYESIKRMLINHKLTIAKHEECNNRLGLYEEVDNVIDFINKLL